MKVMSAIAASMFVLPLMTGLAYGGFGDDYDNMVPTEGSGKYDLAKNAIIMKLDATLNDEGSPTRTLSSCYVSGRGWLNGNALREYETHKLKVFQAAARGMHNLPDAYKLDMLATGVAGYNYFTLDLNGSGASSFSDFKPLTEQLAPRLRDYVEQIQNVMELYKSDYSKKLSKAGRKTLEALLAKIKELRAMVDASYNAADPQYGSVRVLVAKTPFTGYLNNEVAKMRQYIVQNSCQLPTADKSGFFSSDAIIQKRLKDSLKTPLLGDGEKAHQDALNQAEHFRSLFSEVAGEWQAFVESENLDKIQIPAYYSEVSENAASKTTWLFGTARAIFAEIASEFARENEDIDKIMQGLQSGKLCVAANPQNSDPDAANKSVGVLPAPPSVEPCPSGYMIYGSVCVLKTGGTGAALLR